MADAQEDDGYIYTAWTARDRITGKQICCMPAKERWVGLKGQPRAVQPRPHVRGGGRSLAGDRQNEFSRRGEEERRPLGREFGPGKLEIPPGHEEVEIGLVKLYRATGKPRVSGPRQVLHRPPRRAVGRSAEAVGRIQPGPQAGPRAGRGSGSLGEGDVFLCRRD